LEPADSLEYAFDCSSRHQRVERECHDLVADLLRYNQLVCAAIAKMCMAVYGDEMYAGRDALAVHVCNESWSETSEQPEAVDERAYVAERHCDRFAPGKLREGGAVGRADCLPAFD
jgi:hypothetical protein